MAKKMSAKEQRGLLVLALVIGGPILVFQKISEAGAWPLILGVLGISVAVYLIMKLGGKKARLAKLRKKYSDESTVQAILGGSIWDGMSQDQLIDSIGRPSAIDHKYLKTRSREVWKYYPQGKNRYGLRITLDDGRVNGWDSKR